MLKLVFFASLAAILLLFMGYVTLVGNLKELWLLILILFGASTNMMTEAFNVEN